jgi:hypothetical protein
MTPHAEACRLSAGAPSRFPGRSGRPVRWFDLSRLVDLIGEHHSGPGVLQPASAARLPRRRPLPPDGPVE